MKGALRVMLLVFTGFPIQRWLCGIGLLMIAGAYVAPSNAAAGLAFLGLALPLIGPVIDASSSLRLVLSARTTHLIPHAREQVLAGMVLVTLVISSAATLVVWTLGLERLLQIAPGTLWVRIEVISSVFLVLQFLFSGTPFGFLLWIALWGAIGMPILQGSAGIESLYRLFMNDGLLAAVTVAVWLCFGTWFLRVPRFARAHSPGQHSTRVLNVEVDSASARRTLLLGVPSSARNPLVSGVIGGLLLVGIWWLFLLVGAWLSHRSVAEWAASSIAPVLGLATYSGRNGFHVVRRSKVLWLKTGLDRHGLFRTCEMEALRQYAAAALAFAFLPIPGWLVNPEVGLWTYLFLLAFNVGLGACALYLGLMHVRGWRALDVICAGTLICVWVAAIAAVRLPATHPLVAVALIAASGAAALALRVVGLSRWRRVDWLVCKPPDATATPAGLAG